MTGLIKTYGRKILPNVGDKIEFLDWAEVTDGVKGWWTQIKRTGIVESYRQGTYSYWVKTKCGHTWVDSSKITAIIDEED